MARTLYMTIRVSNEDLEQVGLAIDASDYMNTVCQDSNILLKSCLEAMWQHEEQWSIDEPLQNIHKNRDYSVAVLVLDIPIEVTAEPYDRYTVIQLMIDCVYHTVDLDWTFVLPHQQA